MVSVGNGFTDFLELDDSPVIKTKAAVLAPLPGQFAGGGGSEDGLAEAFEDGGDAVQAFAAGVYAREQGIEFVGDAFLFGQRR